MTQMYRFIFSFSEVRWYVSLRHTQKKFVLVLAAINRLY